MKQKKVQGCLLLLCIAWLSGCGTTQEFAYVHDAPRDQAVAITNHQSHTIKAGDRLYIYVYSQEPASTIPFNEESNKATGTSKASPVNGYLVAQSGNIIFPLLGHIPAGGLTTEQLEQNISQRLREGGFVKDAIVTVSLMNFQVTVIGEVKKPQQIEVKNNRITIFEAIARCGDVTMYGIRSCVTVVRTQNDQQIVDTIDLTSKDVFNSPYYYLQQNDIVYVEPTEKRKRQAYRNSDWEYYISVGSSALRLAYVTIYRYVIKAK